MWLHPKRIGDFVLIMCRVSVVLALAGPGAAALDEVIFRRRG